MFTGNSYLFSDSNNTQAGTNWGTVSSDSSGFAYTMSFWLKLADITSAQYLFSNKLDTTNGYSGISYQPSTNTIQAYMTGGVWANTGTNGVNLSLKHI